MNQLWLAHLSVVFLTLLALAFLDEFTDALATFVTCFAYAHVTVLLHILVILGHIVIAVSAGKPEATLLFRAPLGQL